MLTFFREKENYHCNGEREFLYNLSHIMHLGDTDSEKRSNRGSEDYNGKIKYHDGDEPTREMVYNVDFQFRNATRI